MRAPGTAGILLIGDELLSGKVVDENARYLVAALRELGVALRRVFTIGDDLDEIARFVKELSDRYEHVFTSGGVGPTHDDLTMEGVARAFGMQVTRHPELEQAMRGYYGERLHPEVLERNLRMCDVPSGAHLVSGDHPSWPVIAVENVYILPGVPEIFRRKFDSIRERFRVAPFHLRNVFVDADEGEIAGALDRIVQGHAGVAVGSYPQWTEPGYRVKVTLESKDLAQVEAATAALVAALGPAVVRVA